MAVRVKVRRLKLLARLEEVRDEAKKQHTAALKKYAGDWIKARTRAAAEFRRKADEIAENPDLYVGNESAYVAGEKRISLLCVESKVKMPAKPHPHRALEAIERAIALLDQSDDEVVSLSTDDMMSYGIGSIRGLED